MRSPPITVGIIDDDEFYCDIITMILERTGMSVLFKAHDGRAGIAEIGSLLIKPDIIIVDMEMPGMDGFETINFLNLTWPHLRIIAHSSNLNLLLQHRMVSLGARAFVSKNSSIKELIDTIWNIAGD